MEMVLSSPIEKTCHLAKDAIGYWSAGTRLADSARIPGQGIEAGDLPEYMVSPLLS